MKPVLITDIQSTPDSSAFFPWSINRSGESGHSGTSFITGHISNESDFEQTFLSARTEAGSNMKIFEYNGKWCSPYYKDEWDRLKIDQKQDFLSQLTQLSEETNQPRPVPVASGILEGMTPEDAFYVAREEVGPGGIYFLHEKAYTTYTQEEITHLSGNEKEDFFLSAEKMDISPVIEDINDIQIIDLTYENSGNESTGWYFGLSDDNPVDGFSDIPEISILADNNHVSDFYIHHDDHHHFAESDFFHHSDVTAHSSNNFFVADENQPDGLDIHSDTGMNDIC